MVAWLDSPLAADPGRIHTEGHASPGRRRGRPASRSPRCSAPAPRGRVHERGHRGDRRRASGAPPSAAGRTSWPAGRALRRAPAAAAPPRASRWSAATASAGSIADALLDAIRPDTALVHVQWGNHEVGTLQPVAEVVAAVPRAGRARPRRRRPGRRARADRLRRPRRRPPVGQRAQARRAAGRRRAARAARPAARPLLVGGDQERARRAGFENVPAIVGLGAAAAIAGRSPRSRRSDAAARADRARPRGGRVAGGRRRATATPSTALPHLVCLGVDGVEPQAVLLGLDQAGIAAHSGSACASEALEPSPVLEAMGVDADRSLRISVGWYDAPTPTSTPLLDALTDEVLSAAAARSAVSRPSSAARARGRRSCGSRCAPRSRAGRRRRSSRPRSHLADFQK